MRGAGGVKGGVVHAVSDVSFDLDAGETLGVVGETGSGKSTLARCVLQAPRPKAGSVGSRAPTWSACGGAGCNERGATMQMVFQDPYGSLNPRWRVTDLVEEPLIGLRRRATRGSRRRRVRELLDLVGLDPDVYGRRHPHELSGGQCQRVAIARAIALRPGPGRLRRGGVLARRADPGPGAQPVGAAAHRAGAELPVHLPRPRAGQAGQRPGGGDAPGPAVRGRSGRGAVPVAAAPVHRRPARVHPEPRPDQAAGDRTRRWPPGSRRRRWTRRADAGSGPAARGRRSCARRSARCCASSAPVTRWPATSRSRSTKPTARPGRRRRPPRCTPGHSCIRPAMLYARPSRREPPMFSAMIDPTAGPATRTRATVLAARKPDLLGQPGRPAGQRQAQRRAVPRRGRRAAAAAARRRGRRAAQEAVHHRPGPAGHVGRSGGHVRRRRGRRG